MQVPSLDWENPLEEETATYSSILAWENPMDRGARLGSSTCHPTPSLLPASFLPLHFCL